MDPASVAVRDRPGRDPARSSSVASAVESLDLVFRRVRVCRVFSDEHRAGRDARSELRVFWATIGISLASSCGRRNGSCVSACCGENG